MPSGSVAVALAGAWFALAALAYVRDTRAGGWLGAAGAATLLGGLAARGLLTRGWPLGTPYEFSLCYALAAVLAVLTVGTRLHDTHFPRALCMAAAGVLVLGARFGVSASKRTISPLSPVLSTAWLPLHVGAAALGYGALTLAGATAAAWLARERDRDAAEELLVRAISTGYPLLTLSMLLGMIWAQTAWGRYWGWDPKETWTLVTWLLYTLYWHLRRRGRWRGRRLAWLVIAGQVAILFTFLGVGWLVRTVGLQSLHLF